MSEIQLMDLGRVPFEPCVELQTQVLEEVLAGNRPDTLILVEHDPVLTLGASFHQENLLLTPEAYAARGISISKTDRGGDVTYHGPGQLVAYPIFDLTHRGKDLHKWLRDLEQVVMDVVDSFGLQSRRFPPNTGVWVEDRKICAMGVKVRRWVSMHGIAINCNSNLAPFGMIIPCGIRSHGVTSLSLELGREVTTDEVKPRLIQAFQVMGA